MLPTVRLRFLAAVFLFIACAAQSQSINRYYVSNLQPKGVLYFILPQSGFQSKDVNFTYDITYLSKTDSATLNFTVNGKDFFQVQQLQLQTKTGTVQMPVKKLYVESTKLGWTARYSAKLSYTELRAFFENQTVPVITLQNQGNSKTLSCKTRHWKKMNAVNRKIFQVINYNS